MQTFRYSLVQMPLARRRANRTLVGASSRERLFGGLARKRDGHPGAADVEEQAADNSGLVTGPLRLQIPQ